MGIAELESLRVILRGGSVIDWRRLNFRERAEVESYLRLNQFDHDDARDERRLRAILAQAVEYLRTVFGYRVAEPVARPDDLCDLFLLASGTIEPRRYRRIACVVLKVMHVIHHLEARELLFRTPLRESDLAQRAHRRIMSEAERMRVAGLPVLEFVGNSKSRDSLVTKLLAKKESVAAQVFDRVRYRVVTERTDQIAPVVWHLTQALFPFNYAVPGQTQNSLVRFQDLLAAHPRAPRSPPSCSSPPISSGGTPRRGTSSAGATSASSTSSSICRCGSTISYRRSIRWRTSSAARVLARRVPGGGRRDGRAQRDGDSSHERYKRRQHHRVLRRLSRGLVVPKKKGK
jgi:uncharacterized protein (TIGR04552 family)